MTRTGLRLMDRVEPTYFDGRPHVELFSYGEVYAAGHATSAAERHFSGRQDLKVLEIGVLRGHHAEVIDNTLHPELLILVDPWDFNVETNANNWADVWFRVQGRENIVVVKATSEKAEELLNQTFDYIYIDGDHTGGDLSTGSPEGGIRLDIRLWWPRMNSGGIFAGHDYNFENIKTEVDRVFGERVQSSPFHPHGGMEWWVYT